MPQIPLQLHGGMTQVSVEIILMPEPVHGLLCPIPPLLESFSNRRLVMWIESNQYRSRDKPMSMA
jgi:hypothetical protein